MGVDGMTDLSKQAVAVTILAVVVASGVLAYFALEKSESPTPAPDMIPLSRELSELIAQNLTGSAWMSDEEIIANLTEAVPDWASASAVGVEGYSVYVFDVTVMIDRYSRSIPTSSPLLTVGKDQRLNSLLYRNPSETISIPGMRVDIVGSVRLEPIDKGEKVFTTLSVSQDVIDASSAAERLVDLLMEDVSGPGNGLGRDVEYMLNTLARVRAANLYGFKNKEGPSNVLNQGDVELAINLALSLRIASITGQVPEGLSASIDRYFTYQNSASSMNPTGFRQWGVSESRNYIAYANMAGPRDDRRDITTMISSAIERRKADPADLFARYLYLEKLYSASTVKPAFNPFDDRGALEETKLVNARQSFDTVDPNALRTLLSFQPEEGLKVLSPDPSMDGPVLVPYMDVLDGFMVSAREFKVKGLAPSEWYTDVDLNRTPESLVNINYTTSQTRCGGIVPPSKPPDHDFRMEWDLKVEGSFSVFAGVDLWRGMRPTDGRIERTIDFSFPASVLAWYENRPFNDVHLFRTKYQTQILNTTDASGYLIPAEANATEFFEEYTFQSLRGLYSTLTALQRLVASYGNITPYDLTTREGVQLACLQALRDARSWNANISEAEGGYLVDLLPAYLKRGALVPFLKPIHIDGLEIDLEWSGFSDRLDLVTRSTGGSMVLSIHGLLSPPVTYSASIDPGNLRIDLDLFKKEFKVTYGSESGQYREGSGSPNQPDEALLELALLSTWEASSKQYEITGSAMNGYLIDHLNGVDPEMTLSFSLVVRGGPDDDPDGALSDLRSFIYSDDVSIGALVPAILTQDGTWTGIRIRQEGGGAVIVRTIWVRPDKSDSRVLSQDPWTMDLLSSRIDGDGDPGVPPPIQQTQIAVETAYMFGTDRIGFYHHITAAYPGLYAFEGRVGDIPGEWEVVELDPASPLW
jgi:hypothetical protein